MQRHLSCATAHIKEAQFVKYQTAAEKHMTALNEKLLQEALIIESRITNIGSEPHVNKVWKTVGPLHVNIGADIECYTFNRKHKEKLKENNDEEEKYLLTMVYEKCKQDLCIPPIIDSNALELNPNPGDVRNITETYFKSSRDAKQVLDKLGWDFAMGAGHWHISIEDTGKSYLHKNLMNEITTDNDIKRSRFSKLLAANILTLQCLCPALYLRPSRADKNIDETEFTSNIWAGDSPTSTIRTRGGTYENGSLKFEIRMAHLAPYVPVLMSMHAIEQTLKNQTINIADYNESAVTLEPGPYSTFTKGKGSYFNYIETTEKSGYLKKHFPDLHQDLITASILSYATFLADPTWSITYNNAERHQALKKLHALYPEQFFTRESTTTNKTRLPFLNPSP